MLNLLFALATSGLLILAFPSFNFAPLATVALTPLLVALAREHRHWRRFLLGYAAGIVYWFGACYWIQFVLEAHGGMGFAGSWGAFLLFCLAKALHMGVFALAAGIVIGRWYAIPAVAALWVAVERTHGTLGFAWQALGNAGAKMSVPMRLAPITGVYGISFVFVMMSAALALVAFKRKRQDLVWLLVLPLLYLLPALPEPEQGTEQAVLVQPNISETQEWTWNSVVESRDHLATLSLQAAMSEAGRTPKLLVWPEVPAPWYYDDDPEFRKLATSLARSSRTSFLFGTVARSPSGAPFNSAVLIGPGGEFLGRYDKVNLVPFGEYVPRFFGFVNRITKEAGDFEAGSKPVVFRSEGRRYGTFICYEAVFPEFVRRFAADGAEVFVNISNDGYFGLSAARAQHLNIVRMRAAENRRWMLRATNDGVTAVIDPAGRVMRILQPFQEGTLRVGYVPIREQTVYTRWGDWFALLCAIGGIVALIPRKKRAE